MAQKLPIPILAGNSYEISSLSLAISKGYSFRFNNLPQGNGRSTIDKLVRVLDHLNVRIPLKRITLSSETPISTKHFARTIADFEECEWVSTIHLSEAISLRGLTN